MDGGGSEKVEGATEGAYTPHSSPNGKHISYIDVSKTPARLAVLRTDNGTVRYFNAVAHAQLYAGAIWTPNSRSIAYFAGDSVATNVWTQAIDGGRPKQLTNFTSGRIYRIAYSSDGKRLYLARGFSINDAFLVRGFAD